MQKAPTEYVTQTLLRLVELARTRREDWLEEPSRDLEDKEELSLLVSEWVVSANLAQDEVEEHLRFFKLEGTEAIRGGRDDPVAVPTYLGAVLKGPHETQDDTGETDVNNIRQLCAKPVTRVSILRQRTAEEDHILEMILKQEIEVANPPNFLLQSMDAEEMAILTDLIHSLEYPLYAHIAPGQKFSNGLSREALLRLVTAGPEAALQHTQEVQQFKKEIARINLDLETRVITVTFKGKRTAEKWINWKMPFASKFLQLIDYKAQRERATLTNELVLLDYYEFTVAVRRGTMTSTDMFWTLEGGLDLRVKELRQQSTADGGRNDLEWTVLVEGGAYPAKLRDVAYILIDGVEVVIHHHKPTSTGRAGSVTRLNTPQSIAKQEVIIWTN
ncbi:hypothetical protein DVH05_016941 [Phytophthora capsici]|nr:hypothetical protein DVH05_016941 [Phytophthora capsici]